MRYNVAQFRFTKGNSNMTISRIHRGNLTPQLTTLSALRKVIAILAWWVAVSTLPALSQIPQARITSVNNTVMLHRSVGGNPGSAMLKAGDLLQLGDIIDTGRGTVVIAMGDGSQVTIYPNSRVRLKDFSSAGSWRDLLDVVVGRIRARIKHGKRPNPYRVYSPIASIAVRGTDFLVIVESNGETRVFVFEGLVEVSSLINPQQSVLVKPGRNVIVRPDGDISMVMAAPKGELNEIRGLRVGWSPQPTLRDADNSHERNYAALLPSRYAAFSDSHFDSLRNPAYATEFRQPRGRFYLIPSFSPKVETYIYGGNSSSRVESSSVISSTYTLSPQVTYFTPVGSRIVVGGGAAVTRTDLGGAETSSFFNITNQDNKSTHYEGEAGLTTADLSLITARRFGKAERTSIGIKIDYLEDRNSYLLNTDTDESMNFVPAHQESDTRARRTGLSIGITQDFGEDKKLGIYYRYSTGPVRLNARRSGFWGFVNDDPQYNPAFEDFRTRPGHSSEAGVLFRGSVTRRLFYGVESSILIEREQEEAHAPISITADNITYNGTSTYLGKRRANRGMIGAGIGYALRSRTVLSLDISAGLARENYLGQSHDSYPSSLPHGISTGAYDNYGHERSSFRALHIGGQTDIWRNLFAGGSLFFIRGRKQSDSGTDVPEEFRMPQTIYSQEESHNEKYELLNFGAGWRISPGWIVQYIYFTSYGRNTPSHSLMFRYEFGRKKQSNE
jgi:hypothetical protein